MLSSSILYNKFRFGNTDLLGEDFLLFFLSKWTLKEKKKVISISISIYH